MIALRARIAKFRKGCAVVSEKDRIEGISHAEFGGSVGGNFFLGNVQNCKHN